MRERLPASAVAYRLGLPTYGLLQAIELGSLSATGIRLSNDVESRFLVATDVGAFRSVLETAARPRDEVCDPMPLAAALSQVSGPKPWGRAIEAMLDGTMPFGFDDGDGPILRNAVVPKTAVRLVDRMARRSEAMPLPEWITQADASEILILQNNVSGFFDTIECRGGNPKLFRSETILRAAREIVSTGELVGRTGQSAASVFARLRSTGIANLHRGVWPRAQAERVFGEVLDSIGSSERISSLKE